MRQVVGAVPARMWARAAAYGVLGGIATVLLVGIPTAVIPNPIFTRMTPTRPQDYAFLVVTALLAALLAATYALPAACSLQENKLAAGGVFSFLAVGCPVCNKIVVLLLGTSGAFTYFEPLQPVLGVVSIVLLGYAIRTRLRAVRNALPSVPA